MIFYIASNLIPLIILPLGLSIILLLIGNIFNKRAPSLSALLILWFFSMGIVGESLFKIIESPWVRRNINSAPNVDAIVVLSGTLHPAPGDGKKTEWLDPDRFLAGINLYKAGKAPMIFFTGGINPFYPGMSPEGNTFIKEAKALGIPENAMISTPPLKNTAEEAVAIKELTSNSNNYRAKKILLVTSAFHMKRAKKMFERQGFHVKPYPVDFQARGKWAGSRWKDPMQWVPSTNSLNKSTRALREILGRIIYRAW